jgi:hypothetical protein
MAVAAPALTAAVTRNIHVSRPSIDSLPTAFRDSQL